jgi:hypothetical protein
LEEERIKVMKKAEKYPVYMAVHISYEMNLKLEEYCDKEDRTKTSAVRHAIKLMLDAETKPVSPRLYPGTINPAF